VIAAVWFNFRVPWQPPRSLDIVPFARYQGSVTEPDFSPDGSRIVFAWTGPDGPNRSIYWKTIGEDAPHRLTSTAGDDFEPAYSRDGKWIAFARVSPGRENTQVIVVPAQGGTERVVGNVAAPGFSKGLTWWPDGQSLLLRDEVSLNGSIVRLFLKDGRKTPFTFPRFGRQFSQADGIPKLSPDGARVGFIRYNIDSAEVCWTLLADSTLHCVGREPSISGLAWDRTGKFLYYAGSSALRRVGLFDGRDDRAIKIADGSFAWLASDPKHGNLAFTRTINDVNVWTTGLHGEHPQRLIASSGEDSEPDWSPDGSRLLVRSNRSGSLELYTFNADGTGERQITHFGAGGVFGARWSPDGEWIAFDGNRSNVDPGIKHHNIYVVPSSGGDFRQITDDSFNFLQPAWSRDGKYVYFVECDVPHITKKVPLAGGPSVYVGEEMDDLEISRDDKFFYYTRGTGVTGIWRRPVSGGPEIRLPGTEEVHYHRYWDATDDGVFFVIGPQLAPRYLDFKKNRIEMIAPPPSRSLPLSRGLSVSPDRRLIAYSLNDVALSDILLITNLKE
jgi:Tol biopolymer transport system component